MMVLLPSPNQEVALNHLLMEVKKYAQERLLFTCPVFKFLIFFLKLLFLAIVVYDAALYLTVWPVAILMLPGPSH